MKRMLKILSVTLLAVTMLAGCKSEGSMDGGSKNLAESCAEILDKVYDNAKVDQDLRDSFESFEKSTIEPANAENILGTADISYTDSVFSAPMMSSIAYQCVLLRVEEGQDIEEAKALLKEKADPRKWVCVEAESVVVENVGDVILYIMASEKDASAIKESFLALKE